MAQTGISVPKDSVQQITEALQSASSDIVDAIEALDLVTQTEFNSHVNDFNTHVADFTAHHVSNGNNHNHSGGDGARISHLNLDAIGTRTHNQLDYHYNNQDGYNNGHVVFKEASISDPPTLSELNSLISYLDKLYVVRDTTGGNIFLVYARDYNGGEFRYVKLTQAT